MLIKQGNIIIVIDESDVLTCFIFLFICRTGKVDPTPHTSSFNMGYLVSPYPYPNGAGGPIPVSMVSVCHFIVSRIVLPVREKSSRTTANMSVGSKVYRTFQSPIL